MNLLALFLYLVTTLIWGSTWLIIKFQLGTVDPIASVIYRFSLAALLLFLWCWVSSTSLATKGRSHLLFALQGTCLFGINYWAIYVSELHLTSGIVATIFSLLVFFNIFNNHLFLKKPLSIRVILSGIGGVIGVVLVFSPEIIALSLSNSLFTGIALALTATYIASLGNIIAIVNSDSGIPIMASNAWGMLYGSLILLLIALLSGTEFSYQTTIAYSLSLLYLAIPGSIIAFATYLKLMSLIGPERAAYSAMLIPVVALVISTVFEDYIWTWQSLLGLAIIIACNFLAMRGHSTNSASDHTAD